MAIKIRCVDCKKKISIDEAFAGGVCRCPYCTAIVYVPDDAGTKKRNRRPESPRRRPESPAVRPAAPEPQAPAVQIETPKPEPQTPAVTLETPATEPAPVGVSNADTAVGIAGPGDPMADTQVGLAGDADPNAGTAVELPPEVKIEKPAETPTPAPTPPAPQAPKTPAQSDKALAAAHGQANIPTATPVKLQGVVAIILMLLMLGMIGGMVWLGIQMTRSHGVDQTPDDYANTAFTARSEFPAVAGTIKLQAPVVYCIDTSSSMEQFFEPAGNIVTASVKSLKGGKFNVILIGEEEDKTLSPKPIAADKAGIDKLKAFLTADCSGLGDQKRALNAALGMSPKNVVLLAKDTDFGAEDGAKALKAKSVKLHAIALGRESKRMTKIAELTGGESKSFTESELEDQAKRAEQ